MFALFPAFSSAASISLLSGKVIQTGSSITNPLGTTTQVTDGSLETGYTVQAGVSNSSIVDHLFYTFATDQVIDSFKLEIANYSDQNFYIAFLNSSNEVIYYAPNLSTLTSENGKYRLPTRLSGVKKVYLYNGHTSALTVLEWDLYRDEVPSAPFNLGAVAGNQTVSLSWDLVSDANTYTLKRSETVGGPYQVIADNLSSTTFTDASVTNGVTYYYVIVAKNNEGQSVDSNEVNATPQGNVNPEPTGRALLTIYISGGQIKEYDLSPAELSAFLNWYDAKDAGSGPAKYAFTKTWNKGPFKARSEYVIFDKILTFDIDEYESTNP